MPGEHITQEQADEFAIGSLEAPLERAIALHLAECTSCRDIVRDSERLAATFALSTPVRRPPSRLKNKVLSAAGIRRPSPLRRAFAVGRATAGLAAVVVAVGAFTGFVWVRSEIADLRDDNSGLQRQIDAALSQEVEIAALTRKLDDQERAATKLEEDAAGDQDLIVAMMSQNTKIAEVYTPDGAETGIGRFIWDDDQKRAWFVAKDLPKLPTGETYEVWVSAGGSYASLGTFAPDDQGFARHKAAIPQGIASYDSAVVTIERDGNPAKEGPTVFFVADLSRLTQ
jgi:anti-sigma-K factor RskA